MKKPRAFYITILVIFLLETAAAVLLYNYARNHLISKREQLTNDLTDSISFGGHWFTNIQNPDGDFIYQVDTLTALDVEGGNNIVRQAGSLYSLAQLYKATKDPEIAAILESGFLYFDTLIENKGEDKSAVVYEGSTKSNASALLLLALIEYTEGTNSSNYELIKQLSNYLVSTQTPSGDFINSYNNLEISDYNNGETFYALVRSYIITKDPAYLASVQKAASLFKETYLKEDFNSSFFSWGMAGFAYLFQVSSDESDWDFLNKYYSKYLVSRGNYASVCINENKKDCMTPGHAVFLEGVAHIGWIAKEKNPELYKDIRNYLELTLKYLLRYQIGGNYSSFDFESELLQGATCADLECSYVRIDFTQHQMSANYLYLELI